MLDLRGTLRCKIYQSYPSSFQIYVRADCLGIEPGEVIIRNLKFNMDHLGQKADGPWYIRLYASYVRKRNRNKRIRKLNKLPDYALAESEYYNEMVKLEELVEVSLIEQDIKAEILLPIIKRKSKIPNSLIYVDEYWKT